MLRLPNYLAQMPDRETPPIAILEDAADELSKQTAGIVRGRVVPINPGGSSLFRYTFYLMAPEFHDYTDPLFYVWHGINPYPVRFMPAGGTQGKDDVKLRDPEMLEDSLRKLFTNETTRMKVTNLVEFVRSGRRNPSFP